MGQGAMSHPSVGTACRHTGDDALRARGRPRPMIALLAALVVLVTAGGAMTRWPAPRVGDAGDGAIELGYPLYEFDPRDDRALAAYATDIVLGRVLRQSGAAGAPTSAPGQELPQSQFAVEILHTLKGNAAGIVAVNQIGGLDRAAGGIMLLEGDRLLRPGASELFVLVYVPQRAWYQIVAGGYGHLPANDMPRREALMARFARVVDDRPPPGGAWSWWRGAWQ